MSTGSGGSEGSPRKDVKAARALGSQNFEYKVTRKSLKTKMKAYSLSGKNDQDWGKLMREKVLKAIVPVPTVGKKDGLSDIIRLFWALSEKMDIPCIVILLEFLIDLHLYFPH